MRPFKPGSCRRLQAQVKIMGFAHGAHEQVHFTFGGSAGMTEEQLEKGKAKGHHHEKQHVDHPVESEKEGDALGLGVSLIHMCNPRV